MKTNSCLPRGVYTAMITPMTHAKGVDLEATSHFVEYQLKNGVAGFYLTGSTGHGFLLSEDERELIVETVSKAVRGRGKVIVHVGHMSSRTAANLASHAEAAGADAISSLPPLYYDAGIDGVLLHYKTIAECCRLPLLGYNLAYTQNGLTDTIASRLMRLPTWAGFKFSSPNLQQMQGWIEKSHTGQVMFTGIDELMLPGLLMGSDGSIGTFQNLFPREFVSILRDYDGHRIERAAQTQFRLNRVIRGFLELNSPASFKYGASLTSGIDLGDTPPPIPPLSASAKRQIREILRREGFLD